MAIPVVAIVGKPNVGKSTFFNKVIGKRISIVQDEPNVTRDRIYGDAEWSGIKFKLVDTGGIDLTSTDVLKQHVKKQAEIAIEIADVIVFMVDGLSGLTSSDFDVAEILRKSKKKVILTVNKLDNYEIEKTYDFYELGLGEPFAISSEQKRGLGDLLDEIIKNFPKQDEKNDEENDIMKIAIVGKPNVGKSSIINRIVGNERVIVSNIAGTTRDAIDIPFKCNKKDYLLIDTAGMRRQRSIDEKTVERYSIYRTLESIKRADVVLVVFDSSEEISEQDVRIAGLVHEEGKSSVIVMNKWDKVEKDTSSQNKFKDKLKIDLAFMPYFETIFVSALTGQKMEKVMLAVEKVHGNNTKRVTTGTLNDIVQNAMTTAVVPQKNGKKLKLLYITQTGVEPPTFCIFVNDTNLVTDNFKRFLENSIRNAVDFSGTPIRIIAKSRGENDAI